jgi:hypothetical protein
MNVEQKNRLMEKCLEIYERKKWLRPVHQFLERLDSREGFEVNLSTLFWEEIADSRNQTAVFRGRDH